ncbi:CPBP family intramembrane glutamic endopeptidase [Granulicella arctica]|uniref:CPBP family intramembrane glutamic endopeptidase n=1 Tax=Granulicella arctica TaxID=940613 RepID=UPI0021E0F61A|nr:type II CAAX endopeptidase family protein [Granulicella arctica]
MSEESPESLGEIKVGEWELASPEHELPSARVPHFGYALLFLLIAGLLLLLSQAVVLLPLMHGGSPVAVSLKHPKLLLASEGATYVVTLAVCWFVFPLLWHRSFLAGIEWNGRKALTLAAKLIPLGILSGWTVQGISSLISMPKTVPMDDFFKSTSDVWLVTFFGTLLAPLFEEVCFRGFLLPAFAIAFDWLGPMVRYVFQFSVCRLRGEEPPQHFVTFREERSAGLAPETGNITFRSLPAVLISSLVTSACFALLHAQQLGYTWAAVLLLGAVSILLTAVRVKTRSLACSVLVHGSYNFSVFLVLFIATGGYRHLDKVAR